MDNKKITITDLINEISNEVEELKFKKYPPDVLKKKYEQIALEIAKKILTGNLNEEETRNELIAIIEKHYPADAKHEKTQIIGKMLLADSIIALSNWRMAPLSVLADYAMCCIRTREMIKDELNGRKGKNEYKQSGKNL